MKTWHLKIIAVLSVVVHMSACSDSNPGVTASVGAYTMQVSTNPHPLEVGEHASVQLVLSDSENKPVTGCGVKFRQHMPGMEMSMDNTFFDLGEEGHSGLYGGRSGEFSMGGDWVLEFMLQCNDQTYTQQLPYHLEWPE